MFNSYRKYITSTVAFTFLVVGVTGVTFKLFFKNEVLQDIHGWLGLIMVVAATFHISNNWGALRSYFRDRRALALLIPVFLIVALIAVWPEDEKDKARVNPRQVLHKLAAGRIPDIAKAFGKDGGVVVEAMAKSGIKIANSEASLEEIGRENKMRVEDLLIYFIQ